MIIQHKQVGSKGMFFVPGEEGELLAEMVYSMSSNEKMIIEHTEVSDELKGQNMGYQLVHTVVEYARTHGIKITPLCPFVYSVFKKRADFADVLA